MKLLVINTGGTISMQENSTTGKVELSKNNPLNNNNLFSHIGDIEIEELYNLPSPHITEKEMLVIKNRIQRAEKEGYDGVVVTHGTDTLEETAYFLELTLNVNISVVITGAMRSSNEIGADGLANLRSALIVAANAESIDKGVLVVMNDEVHTATYVTKTHTTNVATFQTPTFGPLGLVSKDNVVYFQKLIKNEHYNINEINKSVLLLKAYAGMDEKIIDAVSKIGVDGLVIEAFGAGNLPPKTVPAIERCIKNNIVVVLVSRVFNGVTQDVYDYQGGGRKLKDLGVIFTTGLSGQKARLKLEILLSADIDRMEINKYF